MNRILFETHKKQNIDLLRVRDVFFEKCRKLNTLKNVCQIAPIAILIVTYFPFISAIDFMNDYRDYYSGIMAICSFGIVFLIDSIIDKNLQISNAFREEYDVRVFGLKRNECLYDTAVIEEYKDVANSTVGDSPKYEYWYEEIFSDNHPNNVVCCQMDNIIYTYHVYKKTREIYTRLLIGLMLFIGLIWICIRDINFVVLSFLTMFSALQSFIEYIQISRDLVDKNEFITNRILSDEKDEYTMEDARNIQDCIFSNRESSLFIPGFIRHKYLEDGNPYYRDLDAIKMKLMVKNEISIPSNAEEIDVLSADGTKSVKLDVLQRRLQVMLRDIKSVLEKYDISYTLDGGTLIGAKRENGRYIFWDDDVDIAIRYEDFKEKKDLLIQELSDKYEFQDYYNESFYSPRLSSLRMREKNDLSILEERDSSLCELYEKRGLFIDIYVYAPILRWLILDKIYRRIFIHPIHKRIKKIEALWRSDKAKYEREFLATKDKYLKRVDWYLEHATNDEYYAYTPNYIENLKKAGPYIRKEDLYGESEKCEFEGEYYPVPSNSAAVLKAYYGENWNVSPFVPLEEYESFSEKTFAVTRLKHIIYFDDGTH